MSKVCLLILRQNETSPLDHWEISHMEVFLATLPELFEEVEAEEWTYRKKKYWLVPETNKVYEQFPVHAA